MIGSRWVLNEKIKSESVNGKSVEKEEVRRDVWFRTCVTELLLFMPVFSSPPRSVEKLKIRLAIRGAFDLELISADVSTTYMSSPLPAKVKAVIRLPPGTTNRNRTSTYMVLDHALSFKRVFVGLGSTKKAILGRFSESCCF